VDNAVERYIVKGDYKRALNAALDIEDPIRRMLSLTELLTAYPRDEVVTALLDALDGIQETPARAVACSICGRAFYILDRDEEGERYFELAKETADTISSPRVRGEVLAAIGRNLVLSDRYKDALEFFYRAVELLQAARGLSSSSLASLLKVARLIERSANEIPNPLALDFYRLAIDVYSSLNFKVQTKHLRGRVSLIRDVLWRGRVAVDDLLEKGEVELAMNMMRFLPLEERGVSMLQLSYWLFLHERPVLARKVFEDALEIFFVGKFKPRDAEIAAIIRRFLRVGFLDNALVLVGIISDKHRASSLLGDIAVAYFRAGNEQRALSITEGIMDETVKRSVLETIGGGEDVGHEQGLPLTGGGEERGAVPEDDRGCEVQGEVEQEGGTAAGEGDGPGDTGDEVQLRGADGAD